MIILLSWHPDATRIPLHGGGARGLTAFGSQRLRRRLAASEKAAAQFARGSDTQAAHRSLPIDAAYAPAPRPSPVCGTMVSKFRRRTCDYPRLEVHF